MKTIPKVTPENLKTAHQEGCSDVKKVLENLYGKEFFQEEFKIGYMVECINSKETHLEFEPPAIIVGAKYIVKDIYRCSCGESYLDIGLASTRDECMKCRKKTAFNNVLFVEPSRFIKA